MTTVLLIRRRNKRKRGLLPPSGSDTRPANILTTNSNTLPSNFRNWNGGSDYLSSAPRGIRNNNPGNLIFTNINWTGKLPKEQNKDRRFEMFIAPEYGIRAMIKDLKNDIEKGKNTVPALMTEYAPRFENNTDAYIQTVCKDLKVSATAKLLPTKNTLRLLVHSISRVENGGNFITNELFDKAYAMI
ncbi:MAG: structural protein [Bacteroidetes bacterium HGW-Bacteroidetes-4]|nr:MAG: structural protein [Bacteroidetes bacterium HGW-Bacteroidetes-4]